jgi:hypothetical protein
VNNNLFSEFAPIIRSMSSVELGVEIENPSRLLMETADHRGKRIDVAYAPFDYVNPKARIVIVGMTPGRQQMRNALAEAHRQLVSGSTNEAACKAAKVFASFSGPMRSNLVDVLDHVGVARVLGIATTASLWDRDNGLVQFTSALRYPVFVDDANYSGTPDMLATPLLTRQLRCFLVAEMTQLPRAIYVPLGPKVAAAVQDAARIAGINENQILSGLPHPSGANGERIAYFLGRKPRSALSSKTSPDSLDVSRARLVAKLSTLEQETCRG